MSEVKDPGKKAAVFLGYLTSKSFYKPFLGVVIGAIAGYLYYHFFGCSAGSCGITSNPYLSILFGGGFGYFIVSSPCTGNKC